MATTDKDILQEPIRQHTRMAAGAWINGEQLAEQGSATMAHANSDHGNFEASAIKKDNA